MTQAACATIGLAALLLIAGCTNPTDSVETEMYQSLVEAEMACNIWRLERGIFGPSKSYSNFIRSCETDKEVRKVIGLEYVSVDTNLPLSQKPWPHLDKRELRDANFMRRVGRRFPY
jgi:hypothetical protein